jgi:hypothetical protein
MQTTPLGHAVLHIRDPTPPRGGEARRVFGLRVVPGRYSQPVSAAMRTASTRLRAPSLVTADAR